MTLEGTIIKIRSYKHNGKLHREWEKNWVLSETHDAFITINDQVVVKEADGSYWRTKEPALSYFSKTHWFNIVILLRPEGIKYYCNLASPVQVNNGALQYIDYDLDVEMEQGKPHRLLDEDEYVQNSKAMNYPVEVKAQVSKELAILYDWIDQKEGPFAHDFVWGWMKKYEQQEVKWDDLQ